MGVPNEYKIFNKIPKNLLFIGILNYTKKKILFRSAEGFLKVFC